MKKIIFAVFAHPDDEAFGPSATLMTEVRAGSELHLITLTAGENGMNPDNLANLAEVRLQEWRTAGQLIGATESYYFGYTDGRLSNTDMLEITQRLMELVRSVASRQNGEFVIEFMTGDLNGISGHIDHIVAARATCLAFYKLKSDGLNVSRVRLSCITREDLPGLNIDWLFMEAGRLPEEIDETVDARALYEDVVKVMRVHKSQRDDGEIHINTRGQKVAVNNFIVLT